MKRIILLITITLLTINLFAQQGQWTWMKGSSTPNQLATYGTQGVFAPGNTPSGLYEACEWTDQQGNFWLFGGCDYNSDFYNDLWEFKPSINQWAWIKGPGIVNQSGIYGTYMVPSLTNNPGGRSFGTATWVDTAGDLWLFGGSAIDINGNPGYMNDLWRYHIPTKEWTWMSGVNTGTGTGIYGTFQVLASTNRPPGRCETSASWTANDNNLWLFGGGQPPSTIFSDLWMYNTSLNQWAWMKGPNIPNQPAVYGTIGIPNPANTPNGRWCYGKWKQSNGDFWLFGGGDVRGSTSDAYNDLWRFNPISLEWTWMKGPNIDNDTGTANTQCISTLATNPKGLIENRACWTINCDNFIYFGGMRDTFQKAYNNLWNYSVGTNKWTLMNGNILTNQLGNYGTVLISSPTNMPPSRGGSLGWNRNSDTLWMFGGANFSTNKYYNDMWRFVRDTACPHIVGTDTITSAFTAQPTSGCGPLTVTFHNTSTNGSIYSWSFGDTTYSSATNPTHTFNYSGTYTVRLIANGSCSIHPDTSTISITVNPGAAPVITGNMICSGSPSILDAGSFITYHWSTGATTQTISVNTPNTYSVTVTNTNGCTGTALLIVTSNPSPTPAITGGDSLCTGSSLTLNTSNYPHYLWSNGTTTQSNTITAAGTYLVTVTDTNGCTGTASLAVIAKAAPTPSITASGPTTFCQGTSVNLTTGTFLNYLWSNAATTQSITVNATGNYIVTVTAANGCTGTASQTITVNPSPIPALLGDSIFCADSSLILNVGTFAQYHWSTGATTSTITVNTVNQYSVTVTDANGCTGTKAINVTITPHVTVTSSFIADTISGCNPLTIHLTNTSTNGITYHWDFGDNQTATTLNATHTYSDSGNFTITLIATNTGPCGIVKDTFILQTPVRVDDSIKVTSTFTAEPLTGCFPLAVTFNNTCTNASSYSWFFGDGGYSSLKNPAIHIYDTGTFHVYLIAYNTTNRCNNTPDSTSLLITVENCDLSIPNTFSPNNDGKNDFFKLIAEGYTNYHLIIFNRWGQKIFESTDKDILWNGKINNTGGEAPDGTYYYIFTANDINASPLSLKGFLTLIR